MIYIIPYIIKGLINVLKYSFVYTWQPQTSKGSIDDVTPKTPKGKLKHDNVVLLFLRIINMGCKRF